MEFHKGFQSLRVSPPDPQQLSSFLCRCWRWHRAWAACCPQWLLLLQCVLTLKQTTYEKPIWYLHSKSQEEKRPWIRDYDWLKKKFCCFRFQISAFLKALLSLKGLLSVRKRSYCPKITYLHEHFHHLSFSAVSWKQVSGGPEVPPPSSFSIFLFARKDTIFDDTLFLAACCSKWYFSFAFLDSSSWANRPSLFWGLYGSAAGQGSCKWYSSCRLSPSFKSALLSHTLDAERL